MDVLTCEISGKAVLMALCFPELHYLFNAACGVGCCCQHVSILVNWLLRWEALRYVLQRLPRIGAYYFDDLLQHEFLVCSLEALGHYRQDCEGVAWLNCT